MVQICLGPGIGFTGLSLRHRLMERLSLPSLISCKQLLSEHAHSVAAEWEGTPQAADYKHAASRLRAPFWDWAMVPPEGEPIFPKVLSSRTAEMVEPDGSKHTVTNPLYQFTFHPLDPQQLTQVDQSPTCWLRLLTDFSGRSSNISLALHCSVASRLRR